MVEDVESTSEPGSARKAKVPSFSKSQKLRSLYEEVVQTVSKDPEWGFNVREVSYELARGQISKGLFDLEAYVKEIILANTESGIRENITEILQKLASYVIHLYLEAEWLCLSKGFSSSCTSFLRLIPEQMLMQTITESITSHNLDERGIIYRRISDLYALATCDDFLRLMGNYELRVAMQAVSTLGFETHVAPEVAGILSASDAVNHHKSCISALKVFNILLFNRGRSEVTSFDDVVNHEEMNTTLYSILCVLADVTADRDVLCQCGVSVVGMLQVSHYAEDPGLLEYALYTFLDSHDLLRRKFEGDEGQCITHMHDMLCNYDVGNPDHLVAILLSLPGLGCLSVVRGILTLAYSLYGKRDSLSGLQDSHADENVIEEAGQDADVQQIPSFVRTSLCLCHTIFQIATDSSLRVDLNYATLQGIQLMMSFITLDTFRCPQLYQRLLQLPEMILTYWTRKVRRVSNLAICIWGRLMDLSFKLARESSDPTITEYTQRLIDVVTSSFGGNLKLRYLSLQNLVRYIGAEEILKIQPFLIPHLFCALSVPAIKGCATVFLTDLLTKIYAKVKEICLLQMEGDNTSGSKIPLIVLHCVLYPTVIAILHSKQLELPIPAEGRLAPPNDVSTDELELRVSAMAESFKNIFGKIQKDYVFEMLRLSTAFTKCEFYGFLPEQEQASLTSDGPYIVRDHSNFEIYIKVLICRIQSIKSVISTEQITYLEAPFNLAESMCLCNARGLNSVDFVDKEIEGRHLRGVVINDSSTTFSHSEFNLQCFPQVRLFYVPIQKMRDGLGHIKSDLCLNVLKTVACSPKTKQPVTRLEMELILYALRHCMKTSLPSFRQHFVASMKPFIRRLYNIVTASPVVLEECLNAGIDMIKLDHNGVILHRDEEFTGTDPAGNASAIVALHCAYMRLLLKTMTATINPCTSDFKNTTALELLYTTFGIFAEDPSWTTQFAGIFNHEVIVPLYMALFYMSTRQQDLIFNTLQVVPPPLLYQALRQYGGDGALGYICRKSASSLWSIKNLPYMSGAKAMTLLLKAVPSGGHARSAMLSGDIESALALDQSETTNQYEAVLSVIEYLLNQLLIVCIRLETYIDVNNPTKSSCPAGLLSLFSHYLDSIPVSVYSKIVNMPQFTTLLDIFYTNARCICDRILKFVGHNYDQNEAENMGYQIDCRGHLITKDYSYDFTCTTSPEQEYMNCCLCGDHFKCFKLNLLSTPKCSVSDDSNLRPFTVLCWKTMFEFCEAMRAMLQWLLPQTINGSIALCSVRSATLEDPGTNVPLFYDMINDIGRYLISSLLSCRHFGCTDALADLLTWICKKLVILGLQCLLKEWVTVLLDLLRGYSVSDQQWNELFVMLRDSHRRSEPIGRSFTSILKAESDRHKPLLLPLVVTTLLDLCNIERPFVEDPDDGFTVADIRIHSLNILCALFRCKELRWSNNVHAGAVLCTSLRNMSHGDWSVRNSASLLFSSVLHHLVGNDVNAASTEALLDQKLALCNNTELSDQLSSILVKVQKMTVSSSEKYENLNPPPDYAAIYQSSTFVFNFLTRIPLYSFPADVACKLTENISSTLYSSNASIRVMAANILGKNYMDNSKASIFTLIVNKCKLIFTKMGKSNRINGILLLIRKCLDIMIANRPYDLMGASNKKKGLLERLPTFVKTSINGIPKDVVRLVSSVPPAIVLLAAMHVVMVTTNCFENVVLAITIVEQICLVHAKTSNFQEMALHLISPGEVGGECTSNLQILECLTLLATYSAHALGDEVHQRCLELITLPTEQLQTRNDNLKQLMETFDRIKDDHMIKVRAASTLVSSTFMLALIAGSDHQSSGTEVVEPFVKFISFLIETLGHNLQEQRVLETLLNQLTTLITTPGLNCWNLVQLHTIWKAALNVLSGESQYFIHISVFRLFNAIGLRQVVRDGNSDDMMDKTIFDDRWASTFLSLVSECLLYNTDFLVEAWKSCHLYAIFHFGSSDIDCRIMEMAAGILMKAVDPGTDVTVRRCVAQFIHDAGMMSPIDGTYPSDPRGMYMLHVILAVMVLLQDENESIRAMIVASCASTIKSTNLENLKAHICMEHMLEFTLRTMPVEWVLKAFEQLTMLNKDLFNPLNHKLEALQQQILQSRICLTTAAIEWEEVGTDHRTTDLSVLAEMDTVFNVEPQNMYSETLLYMVYVDKLLCKVVRSHLEQSPMVTEETAETLRTFVRDNSSRIMSIFSSHLYQNYEIEPEKFPGDATAAHSIAADPLAMSCCMVGFSRSCLAVLWPTKMTDPLDKDWDRLHTFHRMLSLVAGRVWSSNINEVYKVIATLATNDSGAKMAALSELESLLNLF